MRRSGLFVSRSLVPLGGGVAVSYQLPAENRSELIAHSFFESEALASVTSQTTRKPII